MRSKYYLKRNATRKIVKLLCALLTLVCILVVPVYATMESPLIHKVRRGETLWEIAIKYNIPLSRLIEVNDLHDVDKIKINQTLVIPITSTSSDPQVVATEKQEQSGMYHRLNKGDTIWQIARRYQVSSDTIIKANNITSPRSLKIGEVLFIPMTPADLESLNSVEKIKMNIRKLITVPSDITQRDWQYIVIHHSATDVGNAKSFNYFHKFKRHMVNGLAYHFVITNGKKSRDGEIEVGNRWTHQLHGGHVKSDYYNNYGIGICIVGNFMKYLPTESQFNSLLALVQVLQEQYGIPSHRVVGHGEIKKEFTACPGKLFPLRRLRAKLLY